MKKTGEALFRLPAKLSVNSFPGNKIQVSYFLFAVLFILAVMIVYTRMPVQGMWENTGQLQIGVDWDHCFYPAIQKIFQGADPYKSYTGENAFQNPPWILLLLFPLGLLPRDLGSAVMFVLNFAVYGWVLYKLGFKHWGIIAVLFSPFVIHNAWDNNIDFLIALGMILPPQIGLFLLAAKPQMSAGIILLWLIRSWRKGKLLEVARVFGPVAIAALLSFLPFGFWPAGVVRERLADIYNASQWPITACVGFALLYYAIRNNNERLAMTASPFLSPYLMFHSYGIALLGLSDGAAVVAVIGYWIGWIFT